jgi:hypothetical protein
MNARGWGDCHQLRARDFAGCAGEAQNLLSMASAVDCLRR